MNLMFIDRRIKDGAFFESERDGAKYVYTTLRNFLRDDSFLDLYTLGMALSAAIVFTDYHIRNLYDARTLAEMVEKRIKKIPNYYLEYYSFDVKEEDYDADYGDPPFVYPLVTMNFKLVGVDALDDV